MVENQYYSLEIDAEKGICYQPAGSKEKIPFSWPQFELNGVVYKKPSEFREISQTALTEYKKVREDITVTYPVTLGRPDSTLEVHEKIHVTGKGAVVLFTKAKDCC